MKTENGIPAEHLDEYDDFKQVAVEFCELNEIAPENVTRHCESCGREGIAPECTDQDWWGESDFDPIIHRYYDDPCRENGFHTNFLGNYCRECNPRTRIDEERSRRRRVKAVQHAGSLFAIGMSKSGGAR